MSKNQYKFSDNKKINADLFTMTYGSLVFQLIKDNDNVDEVNKQLDRMGYNIGLRLIEDFLAKTSSSRCLDFKDVAEKIQSAFKMYLSINCSISNWSTANDEFSILIEFNPMIEFVELPNNLLNLKYCNMLCGVIRGALEMVQIEVQAYFVQDQLKGDNVNEIKVKFIKKLYDALPPGEN